MPEHFLDLRLFRYALASAEHRSFRRAAAALNVQQSTVSRGVKSLEHRVGVELFERGHTGIRPTAAGDRLLQEAILGFDHLRRAMERAEALQRGEYGELTVSVSVPFILLGDLFERFREKHAGVSVEIVESTTSTGWSSVQQREVDLAFVTNISEHGGLRSLYIRDERMMVLLPRSHPLAGATRLSLEDLRHERFILGASGLGPDIEMHLARRMAKWGVEPKVQLHRVGQCNLIHMVALGFGVTIAVGPPPRAACNGIVAVHLVGMI